MPVISATAEEDSTEELPQSTPQTPSATVPQCQDDSPAASVASATAEDDSTEELVATNYNPNITISSPH